MDKDEVPPLSPDADFIDEAFDGVSVTDKRCCDVAPPVDFGLPSNLDDIKPRASNEFEATAEEVTRNIATLDFSSQEQPKSIDALASEFDVGVSFQATHQMFAPSSTATEASINIAPTLPSYIRPSATSYRTVKALPLIQSELESAFANCSVSFETELGVCGYSCSALSKVNLVQMAVAIYQTGSEHLIEFRRLDGCRHAFCAVAQELARQLDVTFALSSIPAPPVCDDSLLMELPMPSLISKFDHEVDLLSKDKSRSSTVQGIQVTANLAQSLSCDELCFSHGGEGLPLAQRVGVLASSDDEEIRTVAMAAVANIATLKNVCGTWLNESIPTLVAGAGDDLPHVRREALRALYFLSISDKGIAAKIVRAGAVPSLELEASGGEDDQCPDTAMRAFAEGALEACRA